MTNKEKTIDAIEFIIENYENYIYEPNNCPLCKIYRDTNNNEFCSSCPSSILAIDNEDFGCINSITLSSLDINYDEEDNDNNIPYKVFDNRKQYWLDRLPLLKQLDPIQFTMKRNHKIVYNIMED